MTILFISPINVVRFMEPEYYWLNSQYLNISLYISIYLNTSQYNYLNISQYISIYLNISQYISISQCWWNTRYAKTQGYKSGPWVHAIGISSYHSPSSKERLRLLASHSGLSLDCHVWSFCYVETTFVSPLWIAFLKVTVIPNRRGHR